MQSRGGSDSLKSTRGSILSREDHCHGIILSREKIPELLLDVTAYASGRNDQRRNFGIIDLSHQGRQPGIGADTLTRQYVPAAAASV